VIYLLGGPVKFRLAFTGDWLFNPLMRQQALFSREVKNEARGTSVKR
jgi:hypothetical protein